MAIKYGLDGVMISNHEGRQLDALRDCVPAALSSSIGEKPNLMIQVVVDGGGRRCTDTFKAINCLGRAGVGDTCFQDVLGLCYLSISWR